MKIRKITFDMQETQAWLVIESEQGDYLGTWHTNDKNFVNALIKERPKGLKFIGVK